MTSVTVVDCRDVRGLEWYCLCRATDAVCDPKGGNYELSDRWLTLAKSAHSLADEATELGEEILRVVGECEVE